MSIQAGFPELLRRSRGSGRRLRLIRLAWGRGCSRFLLIRRHFLVMALVLRLALGRLSGFGLRRSSRGLCRALLSNKNTKRTGGEQRKTTKLFFFFFLFSPYVFRNRTLEIRAARAR